MDKRLIALYALRETLGLVGMAVALFWSAGRVDWWPAWAVLAVMGGWTAATAFIVFRVTPGLLAERLDAKRGAKHWDTIILPLLSLLSLAWYILAGLDQRYGWTGGFPVAVQIAAFLVCALGYALFTWATAANAFFSRLARLQLDRGQIAVSSGPYHYVRHPAYLGAIAYSLAVGILLASWPAAAAGLAGALLLILRTGLEDRMLRAELPGYEDYARQVRYRLLPGIW